MTEFGMYVFEPIKLRGARWCSGAVVARSTADREVRGSNHTLA